MNVLSKLYPFQKDAVTETFYSPKGIICLPTGTGKCLARGTKILMYDGTIKNVEDVIVSDKIMGDDGKVRNVLSLANGTEMMYDITPKKGDKYSVNESHILSLKITNIGKDRLTIGSEKFKAGDIVDISVLDYLKTSKTAKHVLKGFRVGVDFGDNGKKLPIDARLLGLWLADGTSTLPQFCVNNDDVELISFLKNKAELLDVRFVEKYNSENSKMYRFSSKLKGKAANNNFLNLLRDNNLIDNKHILHVYKTGSRQVRLDILAAILDGDGHYDSNCFDLTLVNKTLIDDVIFIARSLGFSCYKKPCKKGIRSLNFVGDYFRICISGNIDEIPTLVPRKQARLRLQKKNVLMTGISVEPVGIGEYFGFEIDSNRRFLLGDFTVTHNTFCQASIIANDIALNIDQFRMYVVNAPRILLTYQLLKETYSFLAQNNIEARYMFVHSGGQMGESDLEDIRTKANLDGSDIPFSEIVSTTDIKTIREMMLVSKKQSLPLIIFSTYNSADKIEIARKDLQPISIILNDEAHYLVQEQFHNILKDITYSRCYFFTATMINTPSDCGRGMNNIELYGETLYQMMPREAIVLGKMIRPRIHVVKTEGVYDIEDFDKSLNKIIYESFYQHGSFISDNKDIAPKMLVSVKGTNDIEKFLESDEYKTLRSENVSIYAVASREEIGNNINGNKVRRQDFLKTLSLESKDFNQKIIILHYDVLSEGIDIPSITGIMPLRSLNKSKFLQTFGRAARLDKRDRDNFENNIYAPTDLYKMYKPYAYIIIPNVIHSNEDDRVNLTQIITELRSYGFNPSEDIISSSRVNGIPTIEELTGLNDIKTKIPNIGELIENLEADIEKEENASMTKNDFLSKMIDKD